MSSRPVGFAISKLRIYFLTNAFFSEILKETLLSSFESTNVFYIFIIRVMYWLFKFESTLAKYLLKALAISTSLDTN